jgi:hypothetical protein
LALAAETSELTLQYQETINFLENVSTSTTPEDQAYTLSLLKFLYRLGQKSLATPRAKDLVPSITAVIQIKEKLYRRDPQGYHEMLASKRTLALSLSLP